MIPLEWPSMRSIARWVLPVLVGPSTAVTPAPRARASRLIGEEKEMGIDDRTRSHKGAGWPGRALTAVACHRQWRSVRRGSGFTSRISRSRLQARLQARVKLSRVELSRVELSRIEPSRVKPCG